MSAKDKIHLAAYIARDPRRVHCRASTYGIEIVHPQNEGAIEKVTCVKCLVEFRKNREHSIRKATEWISRAQATLGAL